MKDRFTNATAELTEKNPYVCDSCETTFGHPAIDQHGEETRHGGGHDFDMRGAECIYNCDPMPFGD